MEARRYGNFAIAREISTVGEFPAPQAVNSANVSGQEERLRHSRSREPSNQQPSGFGARLGSSRRRATVMVARHLREAGYLAGGRGSAVGGRMPFNRM